MLRMLFLQLLYFLFLYFLGFLCLFFFGFFHLLFKLLFGLFGELGFFYCLFFFFCRLFLIFRFWLLFRGAFKLDKNLAFVVLYSRDFGVMRRVFGAVLPDIEIKIFSHNDIV